MHRRLYPGSVPRSARSLRQLLEKLSEHGAETDPGLPPSWKWPVLNSRGSRRGSALNPQGDGRSRRIIFASTMINVGTRIAVESAMHVELRRGGEGFRITVPFQVGIRSSSG